MVRPAMQRAFCILAAVCLPMFTTPDANSADSYPPARRADTFDELHGVKVPDPYRWMEDLDSTETQAWVKAEQAHTAAFLEKLPQRAAIRERLKAAMNYDKHGLPQIIAGRLFYSRRTGLQNQPVRYWRDDKEGAPEHLLLDANTLSADGTVSISGSAISDDGKLFAYGLSTSGSDWNVWHIKEVDSGKDLPDKIEWVKFSGASWAPDSSGFYYSRYAEPAAGQALKDTNLNQKLYFHRIGQPQANDKLIYERPDHPKWGFGAGVTDDDRFLILNVWEGSSSKNALFYRDLHAGEDSPMVEFLKDFDSQYDFVGNDGETFYLLTDRDASRRKLVAVNITNPDNWRTILPEGKSTLQSVSYLDGKFIAQSMVDAHDDVRVFDRDGKELRQIAIPDLGSAGGFSGRQGDHETFYAVTGYTHPGALYRYNMATGQSTLFWEPAFPVNLSSYKTELVFYPSKDGTRIPLFITRKKDAPRDGSVPLLLYGYGGFNISLTPSFSAGISVWLELGGSYAVACLRGGGEYGEDWHQAGQRLKKQNVFDDFIAAAEFVIAEKYTSQPKLVISGGSNGGLLVAACVNQRPELFAAACPDVGVMDMLRFQSFTIGWAWQEEYGFPEQKADFENLLGYSPYHNVKEGTHYPPMLIETADHDDRVFPAHSFKYGAAMQHAQGGNAPILMRIETKAGHGGGTPTAKIIDSLADEYAFYLHAVGPAKD